MQRKTAQVEARGPAVQRRAFGCVPMSMVNRTAALAAVWVLVARPGFARDYEQEIMIDGVEDLYALQRSGEIDDETVDLLVALYDNPININRADRSLLYELPSITYAVADAIIARRIEQGPYGSIDDLLHVEGVTAQVLDAIEHFVLFGDAEGVIPAGAGISGKAKAGSIWLDGLPFTKKERDIDHMGEREAGPQAYLRVNGTGYTYFGAGMTGTFRRRTRAAWDRARGQLVTEGPSNQLDLEDVFLSWDYGPWSMIVGSYTAGFGERLTFDRTAKRDPHGFEAALNISEDDGRGRLRQRDGLFGAAVGLLGAELPGGWLDATAMVSAQRKDLYQDDFWYGLDDYDGENSCHTDGDCPDGYLCEKGLNICRSTRLYSDVDPDTRYRYETYRDAFGELLFAGNTTFNFDERTRVGVTGYHAFTELDQAEEAHPAFAPSSRYPRRSRFGAVGAAARWGRGPVDVSGEYAITTGGGSGAYLRTIVEPTRWAEVIAAVRFYHARYENPYGRGQANRDQTLGLAQRNEAGGRLQAVVKPVRGLRLTSTIDGWVNPYLQLMGDQGQIQWQSDPSPPGNLDFIQRVTYEVTRKEALTFYARYTNKDLSANSRAETYVKAGGVVGKGEKRKLQVGARTERLPRMRLSLSYAWSWEDVAKDTDRFDLGERLRGRISVRPIPEISLIASLAFWRHQAEHTKTIWSDRKEPAVDAYFDVKQRLFDRYSLRARYGLIYYRDKNPDRYSYYQLAKLSLEARY